MRVFLLGGTGEIGGAVLEALVTRGHAVTGLSRSEAADVKLRDAGAEPFRGDLRAPEGFAGEAMRHDAVIHCAAGYGDDMGAVDAGVVAALTGAAREGVRVLYTGGCWVYGPTGDELAVEGRAFAPHPEFAWMVEGAARLEACSALDVAVLHPAMVYDSAEGGVFRRFVASARAGEPVEVFGDDTARWPLVHVEDAGRAYADVLEQGLSGHFHVSAETGVAVHEIAAAVAAQHCSEASHVVLPLEEVTARYGAWATGAAMDVQMSAEKLRQEAGWTPRHGDYRQSLPRA